MIEHGIENVGTLLPHDRPVTKGGSMADPTAAQRKMFAKMGIAMPDGSYYIRNAAELSDAIKAVGRGNADHDAIRKHIITRANALHLSKQIPADWNPDGSEKSTVAHGQEFVLAHFGVKGMHWGVRNSGSSGDHTESRSDYHKRTSSEHAAYREKKAADLYALSKQHGDKILIKTHLPGDTVPTITTGTEFAKHLEAGHAFNVDRTEVYARQHKDNTPFILQDPSSGYKKSARHDGFSGDDVEDFLEHFGVKGMHWGVRRPGTGTPSSHISTDHLKTQGVQHVIKQHGVKAVSNEDLQTVITRLNLEQQHARLVATPSRVDKGHNFVRKALGLTKTGIDVVNTVPPAIGAGKKVAGGISTGVKVVRIVNKTRKGQNHMS
jgi:hypothetical protein